MIEMFYSFMHRFLQRSLLCIPKLSEMRLVSSKTMAFLRVWHYISRAKIKGDYLEFGVYEGTSFDLALRAASKFYPFENFHPRFFAFDSFEGLPSLSASRDAPNVFIPGEYQASEEKFKRNIRTAARSAEVHITKGFYKDSLTRGISEQHKLTSAAFVNIDCDLYESTMEALRFVTPILQSGSVLFFDDWYFSGGNMKLGEAGACHDWLKNNPEIRLYDFGDVGIMGKLFIVNKELGS